MEKVACPLFCPLFRLTLDSANDIFLEAAKSTEHSDAKHSNYGVEVGVGASYGAQTGVYAYVGIQAGEGKSYFDGTTYENALLLADTLNLSANRDITLKGGEAHAETINVNAGENLTIESLQESEYGKESESGMNLKVQVSFGTAWEIKDKGGNGGINSAKANGEYLGVNQQSGLFAGDGGYHINVGENTNLVGGAIASSDKAIEEHKNTLTTDTLTLANLENKMSYSATSGSISGGVNSNATGTTPSFNPGIPMHEEGGDTTITYATITDGTITVGGVTTNSAESLGAHTDLATAHTALEKLPDLKQLLADQQAMAAAAGTVISVSAQIASDIAGNAEKTKDNLKNEFGNTLSPEDQQIYNSLTPTQKESVLLNNADATTIAAYNEAQTTISHWGVGGDYSRALSVVTNIIVGVAAGQTSTQLTANAVAPYAAELIGNTFDHTDDPNQVAQLLSHAVLGGVLAYANGGNAASGALAGAGAEAASLAIAQELYPDAFDADGTFHRDRLSEGQANAILALSGAVGAFVGGVSGGGINNVVIDANVAQNAVENNYLSKKQIQEKEKELKKCSGMQCGAVYTKWFAISAAQDASFDAGLVAGVPASLVDTIKSLGTMALSPIETYDAIKELIQSDNAFDTVSDSIKQDYINRIDNLKAEYEKAGVNGAFNAGVETGKLITDAAGLLTGVYGAAKAGTKIVTSIEKVAIKSVDNTLILTNITVPSTTKVIAVHNPVTNSGPLPFDVANTFRSGTYVETITTEPTILYRVYGEGVRELGNYWTTTPPSGPVQSIIDSALDPKWGNTATQVVKIEVPTGVKMYQGYAAQQGGLVGGGKQVVFPSDIKVDKNWIIK
jgi:filamentous hemagglutinin